MRLPFSILILLISRDEMKITIFNIITMCYYLELAANTVKWTTLDPCTSFNESDPKP